MAAETVGGRETGDRLLILFGLLLVVLSIGYRLDRPVLLEDPNDAQYAEVAREMWLSGDWVSPKLNGVLFLNKPPLLYWLIAASYEGLGVDEAAARWPGALATMLTVLLLYFLGRELFDRRTGILAACAYAALPGTMLEARFVRPDTLLVAGTTGALLAFVVALDSTGRRRRLALYGLQAVLAAGVLAKGAVALVLPALPMAAVLLVERRRDFGRRLLAPASWLLFLALVVPWHVMAAWRHPGFAWDYIVNQHFLFFFDRKLPRDSIPISLGAFWSAFALRLLPWTLLVPPAAVYAAWRVRGYGAERRGLILSLAWAGGTLAFFSAAVSRLEHYVLPAVPAVALLIAALFRRLPEARARWRDAAFALFVALMIAALAACGLARHVLPLVDWLRPAAALPEIARLYLAGMAVASGLAALTVRRYPRFPLLVLGGTVMALTPLLHRGLVEIAPLNSAAPMAAALEAVGARRARIVFEASAEYQSCAGLDFYLRRRITLLRPAGFVEPTYLVPHRRELFIDRAELEKMWRHEQVFFVTDPLAAPGRRLGDVVPSPAYTILRIGSRRLVSNMPLETGSIREGGGIAAATAETAGWRPLFPNSARRYCRSPPLRRPRCPGNSPRSRRAKWRYRR